MSPRLLVLTVLLGLAAVCTVASAAITPVAPTAPATTGTVKLFGSASGTAAPAGPAATATAPAAAAAPDAAPQNPLQEAIERSVCTVTVENKWGITVGQASGYLLANGKFAITDLALVSQPDVTHATLEFKDGTKIVCTEFAMADAAVDMVALRVPADAPARAGLPLAASLPPLDGTAAATTAGWRWGTQLDSVVGHLWKGLAIKEVAAITGAEVSADVSNFIRADGPHLDAATGSALLDPTGNVIGTVLDLSIQTSVAPLAIPASTLRASLVSGQPKIRPLSELPKSTWPVRYLRISGQPGTIADLTAAVKQIQKDMICPTCMGLGRTGGLLRAGRGGGGGGGGGGRGGGGGGGGGFGGGGFGGGGPGGGGGGPGGGGNGPGGGGPGNGPVKVCETCGGEKRVCGKEFWDDLTHLIEISTRATWAPATESAQRSQFRAQIVTILKGAGTVGPRFDAAFNGMAADSVSQTDATAPHGVVARAEIKGYVDGPGGRYLLLAPAGSSTTVAVRLDDLMQLGNRTNLVDHREPAAGTWILICGVATSGFNDGQHHGVFLLPLEWMPTAAVAGDAKPPAPADTPTAPAADTPAAPAP